VLGGSLAIALSIWLAPTLEINLVSAVLIVLFGFFFVTVSSRITGEIGSSSNPISGMTVATLLLTCGLFVLVGWTGVEYKAMALTTAALVCVAAVERRDDLAGSEDGLPRRRDASGAADFHPGRRRHERRSRTRA
jgi:uncharacterized oligopeptide transporter (OPT) family protein